MKILIGGTLAANRAFVAEELPDIVYRTFWESKLGGKMTMEFLKNRQNWKVAQDTNELYEADMLLGKSSTNLPLGMRRIRLRAVNSEDRTQIHITETKYLLPILGCGTVGCLCCILPGLVFALVNLMHSNSNRKSIAKMGSAIKERYPDAQLFDY